MIIAIDIGNTNIKIGLFEGEKMVTSFKMSSDLKRTSDEYMALLLQLLHFNNVKKESICGAIVSSVIPQLDYTFCNVLRYCFKVTPLMVEVGVKTGLSIKYESPRELGSDRIITCVAALRHYGAPFLVVDFGTATTFNVVNEKKEFVGGCISLGLKSAGQTLAAVTSKLPQVELERQKYVINQSTTKAIQSGIIYGAAGQVVYLIDKIKAETNLPNMKVIATGGMSEIIADIEPVFDHIDRELSLYGLYYIYQLNS